ncbi:hypothetical protein BBK36DRAFT_1125209 [Trichoderma citrinoviride]|uniref:MARVEL domain-containing protein n=1 Tax=Trichoderma citrinoviride TaxID=58853 RepID=A0A2T4B3D5_9HYPO|nr:hypothetical protein BBK36DRAFT_1125209 [Trichoderma citrinoviride]PTB63824.1 hypothetical protein BBK36DRAFT_1125209 [Trichoderma citrinoviride]
MSRMLVLCFRAVQGLMAAASIALAAYVVNWHLRGSHLSTPPSIVFLLFSPIFTIASLLYIELAPRFAPKKATHPMTSLCIEITNCIFYFAGFIAVAVCLSDIAFCDGSVCMAGRGIAVLAAAQFSLWMASAILAAKSMVKGERRPKWPGLRRGFRDLEL